MRLKKNAVPFDQTQPQTQQFEGQTQPQPSKESRLVLFFLFVSVRHNVYATCTQLVLRVYIKGTYTTPYPYNNPYGTIGVRQEHKPRHQLKGVYIIPSSTTLPIRSFTVAHPNQSISIYNLLSLSVTNCLLLSWVTICHHGSPFGLPRWVTAVTIPPGLPNLLNLPNSRLSVYLVYRARLIGSFDPIPIFCRRSPTNVPPKKPTCFGHGMKNRCCG